MSNQLPIVSVASNAANSHVAHESSAASDNGHRARLLDRYRKNGLNALHPHEILELLLTFVIPRRDTKQSAKKLLERYQTISAVVNAPEDELFAVAGIGERSATMFSLIRDLLGYCIKERYARSSIITSRNDVEAYLKVTLGYRRDEFVIALFLDSAHHILETELVAEGTVNQCALYPRTIIAKALRCSAASMIIAHNHPGGTASPSESDWQITERLFQAGKLLDLPLLDHVLICNDTTISMMEFSRWPGKK